VQQPVDRSAVARHYARSVDRIEIRGLRVFGRHGALEREQLEGQLFVVDVMLEVDLERAAASDVLADTVDYGILATRLAEAVGRTRFALIEALAGHLAGIALEDARVQAVVVRVAKPEAPVAVDVDEVAVTIRRQHAWAQETGACAHPLDGWAGGDRGHGRQETRPVMDSDNA
jgi:7,8-dihydroneopterin aldolase/epimerase/oxygenase